MNIFKIIFIVQLFLYIYSEIVEIQNMQIPLNTVTNIKRFVYLNKTKNSTRNSGLNYTLSIKSNSINSQLTNRFHFYLIKSDAIPHFDFINNPAICCSTHGGIICDEYYKDIDSKLTNVTDTNKFRLINYSSVYSKDVDLNNSGIIEIYENKTFHLQGVYYTIFLFCTEQTNFIPSSIVSPSLVNNIDLKNEVTLNGKIYFFNYNGFLSGELLYATDLYIAITLLNTIITVFWIWRLTNPIYTKNIFQKLFTLTVFTYLFESLLNFHIYNETLTTGNNTLFFEVFILFFSVLKNITMKIITFSISLGYTYFEKDVDPKKVKKVTYILVLYSILISVYYSSIVENKINKNSLSFLILGAFLYFSIEMYIVYEIIQGIKHILSYSSYHNDTAHLKIYRNLYYVIIICLVLTGIWMLLEMYIFSYLLRFYKFFSNYKEIWKMKWLNGYLWEISYLLFYLSVVLILYPREETNVKSGTQPDFDEFSNEPKSDDFKVLELS